MKYENSKIAATLETFVREGYCVRSACLENQVFYNTVLIWVTKHYLYKTDGETIVKKSKV